MIQIEELQKIYTLLDKKSRLKVINKLSEHFELSKETIRSHWLSRWSLPKTRSSQQVRRDVKEILNKQLKEQQND